MPAIVKVAAPNGDVDTIAAKEWVAKNPPELRRDFKHDFNTHYYDRAGGLREDARPRRRVPEHLPGLRAAGEDHGLPAQGADDARLPADALRHVRRHTTADADLPAPAAPSTGQRRPARSSCTSKAWGHVGGNDSPAQIVDPRRNNAPLTRLADRQRDHGQPATDATGAITSTAAQVIAAINANPAASALVEASKYRTNAGRRRRRCRAPSRR